MIAVALQAQNGPPTPLDPVPTMAVRGIVVDKETRAPIAGANVGGAFSDAGGNFQVQVGIGNPSIVARASGYEQAQVGLSKFHPDQKDAYVEVLLKKLQSLRGVIVDDATRKPIQGLTVEAIENSGPRRAEASAVTGPDGSFAIMQVRQGEYFLRISAGPAPIIGEIPAKALEGDGREKALEPPEGASSYGTIVWPGNNADIPTTPGIKLGSTPVDLGEIRLVRTKLANISGLVAPCEDGANVQIILSRAAAASSPGSDASRAMLATKDIACGAGIQILNLPDGTFDVAAVQGFPQRRWVSQTIDSHARSPLRLTLSAFSTLQISLEVDGAKGKAPAGFRISLVPENPAVKIDAPALVGPGALEATVYPGERYRVSTPPFSQYYVKQIFSDGAPLPEPDEFTASLGSLSHLTVVLDRAGSVEVHVRGGTAVPNSSTGMLLKEGATFADYKKNSLVMAHPDPDGVTFMFAGLAPGKYKAIYVLGPAPDTETAFQEVLADSSHPSSEVTVEAGDTAKVSLDAP